MIESPKAKQNWWGNLKQVTQREAEHQTRFLKVFNSQDIAHGVFSSELDAVAFWCIGN